ncbi:MAG: DUF1476 domain-containing protein [Rhodospirillales bacterium]|nr:DUF1476 domain-containing protein [Rhodospirillales bacterium]
MVMKPRSAAHEREHLAKHEEEFKIAARRNRLLGRWAAAKMGLSDEDAEAYAREVVACDLDEPGEDDVRRKLLDDFAKKAIIVTEKEISHQMASLFNEARAQLAKGNS